VVPLLAAWMTPKGFAHKQRERGRIVRNRNEFACWFWGIILGAAILGGLSTEPESKMMVSLLAKIGIVVVTIVYGLSCRLGVWAYVLGFLTLLPLGVWISFFYLFLRASNKDSKANFHDYQRLAEIVDWFFQNDPITNSHKGEVSQSDITRTIHEALRDVRTKDEFLNYFLKRIALHELLLYALAHLHAKYGEALEKGDLDSIPQSELYEWYNLLGLEPYLQVELRILGWLFNKTYHDNFDPEAYRDRIDSFKGELLESKEETNEFVKMWESGIEIPDYYQILGVNCNASIEEIEKAYKDLAKRFHPDLQPQEGKHEAESLMKQINVAYGVLKNPAKRAEYDAFLETSQKKMSVKVEAEDKTTYEKQTKGIDSSYSPLLAGVVVALTFVIILAVLSSGRLDNTISDVLSRSMPAIQDTMQQARVPNLPREPANDPIKIEGYHDFASALGKDEILTGVIKASSLNLRSGPGTSHNIIGVLNPEFNFVIVHGKKGNWYFVDWVDVRSPEPKGRGWVNESYIDLFKFNSTSGMFTPVNEQELSSN
jgi:hypothetical protein